MIRTGSGVGRVRRRGEPVLRRLGGAGRPRWRGPRGSVCTARATSRASGVTVSSSRAPTAWSTASPGIEAQVGVAVEIPLRWQT